VSGAVFDEKFLPGRSIPNLPGGRDNLGFRHGDTSTGKREPEPLRNSRIQTYFLRRPNSNRAN
jgi:hypothetical protein